MKRYTVAYLREYKGIYHSRQYDTFEQALSRYKRLIEFDCKEVTLIDNENKTIVLRFDEFRSGVIFYSWH